MKQAYSQAQIDELCMTALKYFKVDDGLDRVVKNMKTEGTSSIISDTVVLTNRIIVFRCVLYHFQYLLNSYEQIKENLPEKYAERIHELHVRQFETLKRWNETYDVHLSLIENYITNWQQ
jgi:hypothetical protein